MNKFSLAIFLSTACTVSLLAEFSFAQNSTNPEIRIAKLPRKVANKIKGKTSKEKTIEKHIERSISHETKGEIDLAIVEVTKAIRIKPDSIYFFCRRGDLFTQLERFYSAHKDYLRALNIVPISAKDHYYKALALNKLGRYFESLKYCDLAIKKQYSSQNVYKLKGKCYFKLNQYKQAIVYLKKAVSIKPTVTSYLYLSKCYRKLPDLKAAESILAKAKAFDSKSDVIMLESAIVMYRLKKLEQSQKLYFAWSQTLSNTALPYPNWKAFQNFCETEKKIDYYSEMIALSNNSNAAPIYERALLHSSLAQYELAADEMLQYLELTKWNGKGGIMASSYAIICYRLCGKHHKANRLIAIAESKFNYKKWPLPIFHFFSAKITSKQLLNASVNKQKKTVAYYFIALNELFHNRLNESIKNLVWIKENGDPGVDEFNQAILELDRLKRRKELHNR